MPLCSTYSKYEELERPSKICGSHVLSRFLSFPSLKCKSSGNSLTSSSSDESSDFSAFSRDNLLKHREGMKRFVVASQYATPSISSSGTGKMYILGASTNSRDVGSGPTSLMDCMLFGGPITTTQNTIGDTIKTRSMQMDQICVRQTPARPIQPSIIQLDPLTVNEMKNKHLQNGKRGSTHHRRLIYSTSTITSNNKNTTNIDIGSKVQSTKAGKSVTQMPKWDSEKDSDRKAISSLFDVAGQPNVPESSRLHALKAIELIVKDRQEKLEVVSACSDRCQKKLKDSNKKVEEVTIRGSKSATGKATIAELKRESRAYRAEAFALREEMEAIRKELDTLRRYLPVVQYNEVDFSTAIDENGMELDERFNLDKYPGGCFQNEWGELSFETDGLFSTAGNKGVQYKREQTVHISEHRQDDAFTKEDPGLQYLNYPNTRSGSSMDRISSPQPRSSRSSMHFT
jgi:hypothetical protein